jgi:glycerate-2-kinase
MIDESSEFGARVARHLREETVVWLTTVTASRAPLPRPVGFLWGGGETVSVYRHSRGGRLSFEPRRECGMGGPVRH